LNYELDTYLDALQNFPDHADTLKVAKGNAFLIKKDIFKNLMWYTLPDSNKQYPLTIDRVLKIKQLNAQGIIPEELEAVEVTSNKPKAVEPEFVDVVGQISLRSLEKNDKKRRQQQQQRPQGPSSQRPPQGRPQGQGGPRPQQSGQQPGQNPRPPQQGGPRPQHQGPRPPQPQRPQGQGPKIEKK
jgi:hypothetical protein